MGPKLKDGISVWFTPGRQHEETYFLFLIIRLHVLPGINNTTEYHCDLPAISRFQHNYLPFVDP